MPLMAATDEPKGADGPERGTAQATGPELELGEGSVDALIVDFDNDAPAEEADSVFLSLADLLPDAAGEVVLLAGEEVPINLMTFEPVTAEGIADHHVTASGLDVTGLHFYSFESGITVYSPLDLLIIHDPNAA